MILLHHHIAGIYQQEMFNNIMKIFANKQERIYYTIYVNNTK